LYTFATAGEKKSYLFWLHFQLPDIIEID